MNVAPLITSLSFTDTDQMIWTSARIREYCGWHIAPSISDTEVLDSDGASVLLLPTLHLTDVASVTGPDGPLTDFTWSKAGMLRGCWPYGYRSVTVAFTHGYTDVPDEIAEVATAAALRTPAQMAGISQEAAGGVSRSFGGLLSGTAALSAGWTFSEQMVLDRYKIPARP